MKKILTILVLLGVFFAGSVWGMDIPTLITPNNKIFKTFDIELEWKPVLGAKSYVLQTYDRYSSNSYYGSSYNIISERKIVTSTSYILDKSKDYFNGEQRYWRVQACANANGTKCGDFFGRYFRANVVPTLITPNNKIFKTFDIELEWKPVLGAKSYVLQTYDRYSSNSYYGSSYNIISERKIVTSTSYILDKSKDYFNGEQRYWRVQACANANGGECGLDSAALAFKVDLNIKHLSPVGSTVTKFPMILKWNGIDAKSVKSYKYVVTNNDEVIESGVVKDFYNIYPSSQKRESITKYIPFDSNKYITYTGSSHTNHGITGYRWNVIACSDEEGKRCFDKVLSKPNFNVDLIGSGSKTDLYVGSSSKIKREKYISKGYCPVWPNSSAYNCVDGHSVTNLFTLDVAFQLNNSYNLKLKNNTTNDIFNAIPKIAVSEKIKLEIEFPDGEWFLTGGLHDTPPIYWVDDAKKDYQALKDISSDFLYVYKVYNKNRGLAVPLYPKLGLAATDPVKGKKLQLTLDHPERMSISYDQDNNPILTGLKPGIVHLIVHIPPTPTYQTIDNVWFDDGEIPATTKEFTIVITGEEDEEEPDEEFQEIPIIPETSLNLEFGDHCQSNPSLTFSWEFTDPDIDDSQTSYQIQISDDPTFLTLVHDSEKQSSPIESNTIYMSDLQYNKDYHWRVMVWDKGDNSSKWTTIPDTFSTREYQCPSPDFSFQETEENTYQFTNLTQEHTNTLYLWDFGNGETSSEISPLHQYQHNGNYTVILTAYDIYGNERCTTSQDLKETDNISPTYEETSIDWMNW